MGKFIIESMSSYAAFHCTKYLSIMNKKHKTQVKIFLLAFGSVGLGLAVFQLLAKPTAVASIHSLRGFMWIVFSLWAAIVYYNVYKPKKS